jgi:hypothetical protein
VRRSRALIALAATFLLGAIFFLLLPSEPHYNGINLSTWLFRYYKWQQQISISPDVDESQVAIRKIGTNALPYLLKWLPYQETAAHKKWVSTVYFLARRHADSNLVGWLNTSRRDLRSIYAATAFRALGSEAAPAIPALTEMVTTTNYAANATSIRAIYALASIGDPAVPALVDCLSKPTPTFLCRIRIVELLGYEPFQGEHPSERVPALLKCLQDEDDRVILAAASSLGKLACEPDTVVPALQATIENRDTYAHSAAIGALGRFGPSARSALPS